MLFYVVSLLSINFKLMKPTYKSHIHSFASLILILVLLFFNFDLSAQCAMCKAASESNLQNGGNAGKGLNGGILYMLSLPYIIFAVIAFVWWKKRNNQDKLKKVSFINDTSNFDNID
jgi:hypothetical protein